MSGAQTRTAILMAAVQIARENGLIALRQTAVANAAMVTRSLIQHHFTDMATLKAAVMQYAITTEDLAILGHAILSHDPAVAELPAALRKRVAKYIAGPK